MKFNPASQPAEPSRRMQDSSLYSLCLYLHCTVRYHLRQQGSVSFLFFSFLFFSFLFFSFPFFSFLFLSFRSPSCMVDYKWFFLSFFLYLSTFPSWPASQPASQSSQPEPVPARARARARHRGFTRPICAKSPGGRRLLHSAYYTTS